MINLVKSRDPRLARRNAGLGVPSAATAGVSSTVVAGVQIPAQPDSGRLGRIPKRVDPRLKAQQADADRKKVTSTTTSGGPSLKSRAEYDPTKKRDRKDDARLGKTSSLKSSSSENKKKSSSESSPSKSPSSKKKSSSAEKSPSRSEKSSPKSRESSSSKHNKISSSSSSESIKSATRRPRESSKSPNRNASPAANFESLVVPITNESKDVDLRVLLPEKKLKLDHQHHHQQANLVMKPVAGDQSKSEHHLLPSLSTLSSSVQKACVATWPGRSIWPALVVQVVRSPRTLLSCHFVWLSEIMPVLPSGGGRRFHTNSIHKTRALTRPLKLWPNKSSFDCANTHQRGRLEQIVVFLSASFLIYKYIVDLFLSVSLSSSTTHTSSSFAVPMCCECLCSRVCLCGWARYSKLCCVLFFTVLARLLPCIDCKFRARKVFVGRNKKSNSLGLQVKNMFTPFLFG